MAVESRQFDHSPHEIWMPQIDNASGFVEESTHTPVITDKVIAESRIMTVFDHLTDDSKGEIDHGMRDRLPGVITRAVNSGALEIYVAANIEEVTARADAYMYWLGDSKRWDYPTEMVLAGNRKMLAGILDIYHKRLENTEIALRERSKKNEYVEGEGAFAQITIADRQDAAKLAELLTRKDDVLDKASEQIKKGSESVDQASSQKALPAPVEEVVVEFKNPTRSRKKLRRSEMRVSRFDVTYPDSDYANIMPDSQNTPRETTNDHSPVPQQEEDSPTPIKGIYPGGFVADNDDYREFINGDDHKNAA